MRRLMDEAHTQQLRDLESRQEKEKKELKARQAKMSMETCKQVMSDKTIKNKAERDRRIRELNENNTKKFIEERKRQAVLQSRQIELLKKLHLEQNEILTKDSQRVSASTWWTS
ncbi:hypothetical protein NP493_242g03063 [Ridgeia piscesae]|uniref:Uncharacterized protein n=1 Tax=Ridgeia piscesae TaxID=27915 RepID=A0AAD9NYN6_RIDPI|nr:hypothetical protein NP493_242g03063 [Ridgeia piscesae]